MLEGPDRDEVYADASVAERRLGRSVQVIGRLACRRQRHAHDTVARGAFATDDENSPGGSAAEQLLDRLDNLLRSRQRLSRVSPDLISALDGSKLAT